MNKFAKEQKIEVVSRRIDMIPFAGALGTVINPKTKGMGYVAVCFDLRIHGMSGGADRVYYFVEDELEAVC